MSGGVQKRWLSVKSRIIRSYFEKKPRSRKKSKKVKKRINSLQYVKKIHLPGEDHAGKLVRSLLAEAVQEIGPYSAEAGFGDPAFIGSHALNMFDRANWVETEGSLVYKSPPDEAEHLERLEARRQAHEFSSTIEERVWMAISDPAKGSPDLVREAVDYAARDVPDYSDTDYLMSRSTRLVSTAMLVARDGEDVLLDVREDWVRAVISTSLAEEADRYASNGRLNYNRSAQGICALIHLWHRKRRVVDRDHLLQTVSRQDQATAMAMVAAHESIRDADPRLIKAAVRIAFTCCRSRRHPYDENASAREAYEEEKAGKDADAVAAEIAWLDGGPEPIWPVLPEEAPSFSRQPHAKFLPNGEHINFKRDDSWMGSSREAVVHVNDQKLSRWVRLLNVEGCARPDWYVEIVDSYALWSARMDGHRYSADAELFRPPYDWNNQFYALVSTALMDAAKERFSSLLQPIIELPDQPFCDVGKTIIHAADVHYFNEPNQSSDRACALRQKMVTRAIELDSWHWDHRRGELGIDLQTGPMIGTLLMNLYSASSETKTYLVPAVFDRVDPLLETLRPMMPGGPTAFIALCTMNTVNVAPTSRHLEFLLGAVETWLDVTNGNRSMWHEIGIGRKVAEWFATAAINDPSLYDQSHSSRSRIDAILGRLVSLGVSETHELEVRIQTEANGQTPR